MKRMITQEMIDKLSDLIADGGLAWLNEMKDLISYDEGNVIINSDIWLKAGVIFLDNELGDGWMTIPEISSLRDYDDNAFFPSLTDQAGKVVKVNSDETGFEYGEVSGGTQLYLHHISYSSQGTNYHLFKNTDDSVYIISLDIITNSSTPCSIQSIMGANRLVVEGKLISIIKNLTNDNSFFAGEITSTKVFNVLPYTLMSFNTDLTQVDDTVTTL